MNKLHMLGWAVVLFMGAGVALADRIALPKTPPQEKVLAGILVNTKGQLSLKVGDDFIYLGGKALQNLKKEDVQKLVGKQVKVTAKVHEIRRGLRRELSIYVVSVSRIEAAPAAKS